MIVSNLKKFGAVSDSGMLDFRAVFSGHSEMCVVYYSVFPGRPRYDSGVPRID